MAFHYPATLLLHSHIRIYILFSYLNLRSPKTNLNCLPGTQMHCLQDTHDKEIILSCLISLPTFSSCSNNCSAVIHVYLLSWENCHELIPFTHGSQTSQKKEIPNYLKALKKAKDQRDLRANPYSPPLLWQVNNRNHIFVS